MSTASSQDISNYMAEAKQILADAKGKKLSVEERRERSIELASLMLKESRRVITRKEQSIQNELHGMMQDPKGKPFTTALTDECFRSNDPNRTADQIIYLLNQFGIPHFLSYSRQLGLQFFKFFGNSFANALVPLFKRLLRKETSHVILPGENKVLFSHIKARTKEGVRVNLNHLGEAILGEDEAKRRLEMYLADLARPEVEYISVKVSTLFSQINILSWEKTLEVLAERLKILYRAAKRYEFQHADGRRVKKFVNLDMEEYRDLHLTCEVFRRVLDDPEFYDFSAGIVLQSYLPDSHLLQQELVVWAMRRLAGGGAPIKMRIVKGANLAMERIEAAVNGWPQAPYKTKADVDANFKRMLVWGLEPDHVKACLIGVASHNLLDIAYALLLREENGVQRECGFEMLEGMADQMRRTVQELAGEMLLYCPAATKQDFSYAIAYLVRRLDENSAPENFMCHLFGLIPGTRDWQNQVNQFSLSCHAAQAVSLSPRRTQNRFLPLKPKEMKAPFSNEPDTDFSLPQNRKWAEEIVRSWKDKTFETLPLVVGGKEILSSEVKEGVDPSVKDRVFYTYSLAESRHIDQALKTAEKAKEKWSQTPPLERSRLLALVAEEFRKERGSLIGAMVADGAKTVQEADKEISEAIDFLEYYRRQYQELVQLTDLGLSPKGVVVVTSPWNFPCAIPTGGIAAALISGNAVIFKPARETALVGYSLAKLFWQAGVSKEVLQFVVCQAATTGSELISDPRVSTVILTGSTETAKKMLQLKTGLDLHAETGGKNSIIVSALSDRDLAIKEINQSAFSHSGQKCSACSLAILLPEVYDDPHFLDQLKSAAASLEVTSAWDLSCRVNPLITTPSETLSWGLTTLEEGESWLLEPKQDPNQPNLWSPGIKLGVKPGSKTHQTEFFGPVLGLMRANSFAHAIEIANGTDYGLTAGLQSLDEREQALWKKEIEAGNLYINRSTTGAIVRRQPFGGCKASSFGLGAKAGGPNYLLQFTNWQTKELPKERDEVPSGLRMLMQHVPQEDKEFWEATVGNYVWWWNHYFSKKHDPSQILGQDNDLIFVPHKKVHLRLQPEDSLVHLLSVIAAAQITKVHLEISLDETVLSELSTFECLKLLTNITICRESEAVFIQKIEEGQVKRLRLLSSPSLAVQTALAETGLSWQTAPLLSNGRVELFNYLRECAISFDYHRYGNLGLRENEERGHD